MSVRRTRSSVVSLPIAGARALHLAAQGLLRAPAEPASKPDVLDALRRMGALQIDTIHVVARSPYLVLWSRIGDFEPVWLDELLAEGALFEHWAHAACFLPIDEYPFYRRRMLDRVGRGRHSHDWVAAHAAEVERLLDHIRANGPVRSADFERTDGRSRGWWDWKPEKQALEHLHTTGALMIARRQQFQRLYDLRERVLPGWDDATTPPLDDALRHYVLRTVRALGVATAAWTPDYFRLPKAGVAGILERLADEAKLVRVAIEGIAAQAYVHADHRQLLDAALAGELASDVTALLPPFDPVVWDRARARTLFGFDYTIECYTPEPKRRYGYFTLPILHRGALVGRLDPKAHRKEGVFEVKALHLEPGVPVTDTLIADLATTLRACAVWHKTPEVVVRRSDPPALAGLLEQELKR